MSVYVLVGEKWGCMAQVYEAVKLPESVYKVVSVTATTTAHAHLRGGDRDARSRHCA